MATEHTLDGSFPVSVEAPSAGHRSGVEELVDNVHTTADILDAHRAQQPCILAREPRPYDLPAGASRVIFWYVAHSPMPRLDSKYSIVQYCRRTQLACFCSSIEGGEDTQQRGEDSAERKAGAALISRRCLFLLPPPTTGSWLLSVALQLPVLRWQQKRFACPRAELGTKEDRPSVSFYSHVIQYAVGRIQH